MPAAPPPPYPAARKQEEGARADVKDKVAALEPRKMSKLHPELLKLQPSAVVTVEVWLNVASADTISKLERAGLTIVSHPSGGSLVVGTIKASQLRLLEAIDEVRFIGPSKKAV